MNAGLMRDYVEYVADFLLGQLGMQALFGKCNPVRAVSVLVVTQRLHDDVQFPFMETTVLDLKINFFERPPADYLGVPLPRLAQ